MRVPNRESRRNHPHVGVIDIGSRKVCCLIGQRHDARPSVHTPEASAANLEIIGHGYTRADGIRAGVITDMDAAERAIRSAVECAEAMAGVRLEAVTISTSAPGLRSENITIDDAVDAASPDGGLVLARHIERLAQAGLDYAAREPDRTLLDLVPTGFVVDGQGGIRDPRGMRAARLALQMHLLTADQKPIRNLMGAVERCHLKVAEVVPSAYASSLAVLSQSQRELGVVCVDIGAENTNIALFARGHFLFADSIPIGGAHLTRAVAQEFGMPFHEAERIKTIYGNLFASEPSHYDLITYRSDYDEGSAASDLASGHLQHVLREQAVGILTKISQSLARSELGSFAGGRFVFCGGTSQLLGFETLAGLVFGRPVVAAQPRRLARPAGIPLTADLATAVGLLLAADEDLGLRSAVGQTIQAAAKPGLLGRMAEWLREGF